MLRVGLFITIDWWCEREFLDGVTAFLGEMPPAQRWECVHIPFFNQMNPAERFDGAMAVIFSDHHARRLLTHAPRLLGVLSCDSAELKIPHVVCDDRRIGEAAARELIERGFRDIGFVTFDAGAHSYSRLAGAVGEVRKAGAALHEWSPLVPLRQWLPKLPKPVGVMASNDYVGKVVLDACRAENIRVPQDVAVIGVDNDPQLCELSWPPLASITGGHFQVGRRAAERLHAYMTLGRDEPGELHGQWVEPVGFPEVIVRASVDGLAVDDDVVTEALQFITAKAHEGIGVEDVCAALSMGRRSIEIRFRRAVGRTILQEIHRSRVAIARRLLTTRRLSVDEVARLAGFSNQTRLGVIFRQITGMTPTAYRRRTLGLPEPAA